MNVTRGTAGTAALSSVANGSTVNLIGNSRNGAEVNQTGLSTIGIPGPSIARPSNSPSRSAVRPRRLGHRSCRAEFRRPFDFNMTVQLQNMVDDIETSCYYGIAQAPTADSGTPDTAGDRENERPAVDLPD